MNIIKTLRENNELANVLDNICDIRILPELVSPSDAYGRLTFNIKGKVFAQDASGGEYIILDDGTIGFYGSEGENGRIADNFDDFFLLMVNCPFWRDYIYKSKKGLFKIAKHEENSTMEQEETEVKLREEQQTLAKGLNIPLYDDVSDILLKFYQCANREPRFISVFKEKDGSITYGTGSLFEL